MQHLKKVNQNPCGLIVIKVLNNKPGFQFAEVKSVSTSKTLFKQQMLPVFLRKNK